MRWLKILTLAVLAMFCGPLGFAALGDAQLAADWRTASRESAGIAPDPATTPEAVVQIYAARAFNWRGAFAVHTWVAVKPENAPDFVVMHVIGWRHFHGASPVAIGRDVPDRRWYGNLPEIILDMRGPEAQAVIPKIIAAARSYPYADFYRTWPGPNSNTFVAHIGRSVPELRLSLPATAIGKDWTAQEGLIAKAPSNTGYQLSLFGLLGVLVAAEEGVELNLLSLTFGIDPTGPALKLPGIGRLGWGAG